MKTFLIAVITLGAGVTAWTQQTDVVQQALSYFYQARQGNLDVVPKVVSMLEEATAADPNNGVVWRMLGSAYFLQLTAAGQAAGNPPALLGPVQRASGAFERAIQIDPNDADALAGHGMTQVILSGVLQERERFPKGVAEMNRAVALSPSSANARLLRAFTSVNFPPQIRDTPAVIEDLDFLLRIAEGSRAGDVLHILLGDLYAETGQVGEARRHYDAAAKPSSTAREKAGARLTALEHGAVRAAEIRSLRGSLGSNCMMCHAK